MEFFMTLDYPIFHFIMTILSLGFFLSIVGVFYYEMLRLLINGE